MIKNKVRILSHQMVRRVMGEAYGHYEFGVNASGSITILLTGHTSSGQMGLLLTMMKEIALAIQMGHLVMGRPSQTQITTLRLKRAIYLEPEKELS